MTLEALPIGIVVAADRASARLEIRTPAPIIALVDADSTRAAVVMRRLVEELASMGATLAGYVQQDVARPGRSRCDMVLENVVTGERLPISEDRGPGARGCRLDADGLARAMTDMQASLAGRPDLLVLNKFGKSEAEGGGFRALIAEAVERRIPIVLGVPWRNIDGWRAFAGDLCHEIRLDELPATSSGPILEALGMSASPQATVTSDVAGIASPAEASF